ncbi:unnamed protein product, partial [Brassica oleracea var. botrytis]
LVDGEALPRFSASSTWGAIRNREETVAWSDSIWFKSATPPHALPTRVRLSSWRLGNTVHCLCESVPESRDHLLLRC